MDIDVLVAFIHEEPSVNPGRRRSERTIGLIPADLIVQLVALKIIRTRFLVGLAMKFELNFSRGFPGIDHARAFLHVIFDFDTFAGTQAQVLGIDLIDPRLRGENSNLYQGFKIALRTLDHTRITIAAQALGIAQGALDYAVGYVKERRQFGHAVADFQGVQFMLADMAMNLEAARQLTYAAAAKSELAMAGEKVGDLTFFSSAAKCLASDVAMSVTTDAVQLLGGYGYVSDYPVERMMRDAKITQIYEGTNQIQRMVMARQLLK